MWNIFEHWWTALLIAAIVQMTLAIIHLLKPDTRKLWHILIPIAIIAIGIGVERFVQTDFEKITILIDKAVKAAQDEDAAAVDALLAPDYSDSCHDSKTAVMEYCRRWFARPLIAKNNAQAVQIDIHRPTAEIYLAAIVHLDPKSDFAEMVKFPLLVKVKLCLKKNEDGKWLIERAELLEINNNPVKWNQI
jgi:hypothetical protein